uniref:Uncharacterized protein n=1 Tax=Setaria italica TaxID=4555 RepID=K3XNW8_SETIT
MVPFCFPAIKPQPVEKVPNQRNQFQFPSHLILAGCLSNHVLVGANYNFTGKRLAFPTITRLRGSSVPTEFQYWIMPPQ